MGVSAKSVVTQGVVLSAVDYLDNDKIVSIFTQDFGVISAKIKGVKKGNAKLKFAALPFCYAQFNLATREEMSVITNAVEVESYFKLTQNYDALIIGSAILELVSMVGPSCETEVLFYALIKALHTLAEFTTHHSIVWVRFMLGILKVSGYQLNLQACAKCNKHMKEAFVEPKNGALVCAACAPFGAVEVSSELFDMLRGMIKVDFDNLGQFAITKLQEKEAFLFVQKLCDIHYGRLLNSLKQVMF